MNTRIHCLLNLVHQIRSTQILDLDDTIRVIDVFIESANLVIPFKSDGRNSKGERNNARMKPAGDNSIVGGDPCKQSLRKIDVEYAL